MKVMRQGGHRPGHKDEACPGETCRHGKSSKHVLWLRTGVLARRLQACSSQLCPRTATGTEVFKDWAQKPEPGRKDGAGKRFGGFLKKKVKK